MGSNGFEASGPPPSPHPRKRQRSSTRLASEGVYPPQCSSCDAGCVWAGRWLSSQAPLNGGRRPGGSGQAGPSGRLPPSGPDIPRSAGTGLKPTLLQPNAKTGLKPTPSQPNAATGLGPIPVCDQVPERRVPAAVHFWGKFTPYKPYWRLGSVDVKLLTLRS